MNRHQNSPVKPLCSSGVNGRFSFSCQIKGERNKIKLKKRKSPLWPFTNCRSQRLKLLPLSNDPCPPISLTSRLYRSSCGHDFREDIAATDLLSFTDSNAHKCSSLINEHMLQRISLNRRLKCGRNAAQNHRT